jgi:predicted RNA binding protein YcfA (HicA-like mRNA interferase family)
MPPKVRDLMKKLESEGFKNRGGKGSHKSFRHPSGVTITISGKPGDDAKHYPIRSTDKAILMSRHEKK